MECTKPVMSPTAITGFVEGNNGGCCDNGNWGNFGYSFNDIFHGSRLADGIASLTATVYDTTKAAELATEKTAAAAQLTIEKTAAANALATERAHAAIQHNMSAMEARLALAASDARAEAAKCCCEIKELIRAESCTTRELINRIDSDNAKVALQNATAELLAIKYRPVPPVV